MSSTGHRTSSSSSRGGGAVRLRAAASKYDFVKVKIWVGKEPDLHYYVLSRYLISRNLTVARIPEKKAVKISKELKKYLVDNSLLQLSQENLENVLFNIVRSKGFGDETIHRYRMVNTFLQARRPLIVLVAGAPFSGKSMLAQRLATRLNLPNVQQTDVVCDLLRSMRVSALDPTPLWLRTDLESNMLIREFRRECIVARRGIDGDLRKAFKDGKSLIVEGLHLDPPLYLSECGAACVSAAYSKPVAEEVEDKARPGAAESVRVLLSTTSATASPPASPVAVGGPQQQRLLPRSCSLLEVSHLLRHGYPSWQAPSPASQLTPHAPPLSRCNSTSLPSSPRFAHKQSSSRGLACPDLDYTQAVRDFDPASNSMHTSQCDAQHAQHAQQHAQHAQQASSTHAPGKARPDTTCARAASNSTSSIWEAAHAGVPRAEGASPYPHSTAQASTPSLDAARDCGTRARDAGAPVHLAASCAPAHARCVQTRGDDAGRALRALSPEATSAVRSGHASPSICTVGAPHDDHACVRGEMPVKRTGSPPTTAARGAHRPREAKQGPEHDTPSTHNARAADTAAPYSSAAGHKGATQVWGEGHGDAQRTSQGTGQQGHKHATDAQCGAAAGSHDATEAQAHAAQCAAQRAREDEGPGAHGACADEGAHAHSAHALGEAHEGSAAVSTSDAAAGLRARVRQEAQGTGQHVAQHAAQRVQSRPTGPAKAEAGAESAADKRAGDVARHGADADYVGGALVVPIVLRVDDAAHRLLYEDWWRACRAWDGGEGRGSDAHRSVNALLDSDAAEAAYRAVRQLHDHLAAYAEHGVPVVDVDVCDPDATVDALHEYVLRCIELAAA